MRGPWCRAAVATLLGTLLACAAPRYHMPSGLRSYRYFVAGSDSLSVALGTVLRRRGVEVVPELRGGGGPTAAVIHFLFRDPTDSQGLVLHVQFADTRTGVVIAAGSAVLEALPRPALDRAEALLDSLGLKTTP
jgi:hypothetical protein